MEYQVSQHDSPQGLVVAFRYKVEVGPHKGKSFNVGISMQGSESYPEYPPHWIHINPPINDEKGEVVGEYQGSEGKKWIALSRPPGALWDQLPTKSMHAYLQEHLRRFWNNL